MKTKIIVDSETIAQVIFEYQLSFLSKDMTLDRVCLHKERAMLLLSDFNFALNDATRFISLIIEDKKQEGILFSYIAKVYMNKNFYNLSEEIIDDYANNLIGFEFEIDNDVIELIANKNINHSKKVFGNVEFFNTTIH